MHGVTTSVPERVYDTPVEKQRNFFQNKLVTFLISEYSMYVN